MKSSENKCSGKQGIMLWKCSNLCFRSRCSLVTLANVRLANAQRMSGLREFLSTSVDLFWV